MNSDGFDRLAKNDVLWLFKGRLGPEYESIIINSDIDKYKKEQEYRDIINKKDRKLKKYKKYIIILLSIVTLLGSVCSILGYINIIC